MYTKLVMTSSALVIGVVALQLSFIPEFLLEALGIATNRSSLLLVQLLGGLYFGFAMLNWMARGSRIGGIYNRPIAVANFAHFFVAGMALIKVLVVEAALPNLLWIGGAIYLLYALAFGFILFKSPV
jgi:hypothetical protein